MNENVFFVIVEKGEKILLLEDFFGEFHLPFGMIINHESINQALLRAMMDQVCLSVKNIKREFTAKDLKNRSRIFVIEVVDPEDLLLKEYKGYGWVDPKEAFGYPIKEDLRKILDLYLKLMQS